MGGDPASLLPVLHYVLLGFSRHVARHLAEAGYELSAKTDLRFVEVVFRALRELHRYRPQLSPAQFLSHKFAEKKIMLLHDVVVLCKRKHNEVVRARRLGKVKLSAGKAQSLAAAFPPKKKPEPAARPAPARRPPPPRVDRGPAEEPVRDPEASAFFGFPEEPQHTAAFDPRESADFEFARAETGRKFSELLSSGEIVLPAGPDGRASFRPGGREAGEAAAAAPAPPPPAAAGPAADSITGMLEEEAPMDIRAIMADLASSLAAVRQDTEAAAQQTAAAAAPGSEVAALRAQVGALAERMDGVHQNLEARLTILEGRMRFLEAAATAPPKAPPAPAPAAKEEEEAPAMPTTPALGPSPDRAPGAPAADAASLSTDDFIASIKMRFAATEDLLKTL